MRPSAMMSRRSKRAGKSLCSHVPPNEFLYVNEVPSAIVITDPSPPLVAPVGDSGFVADPLPLFPPAEEEAELFFLMTVKKMGRNTARKTTMMATAAIPSHIKRRLRAGGALGFSVSVRGASDGCRS